MSKVERKMARYRWLGPVRTPLDLATATSAGCSAVPVPAPVAPSPSAVSGSGKMTSRVIGRPRASALPPRTIRTLRVGQRTSSSNSCKADADADAELTTDWCSVSTEGCGERARRRLTLGRLLLVLFRLNGRGALTLTILLTIV